MSFQILVGITDDLRKEYPENPAWDDSPFKWMRSLPPGSKGRVGRNVASGILQSYGFTPTARRNNLQVNGHSIEVRTALMWELGIIKFQNIRDRKFEHVICIGLTPHSALAWLIPKEEIWSEKVIRTGTAGISSQHKGADAWLTITLASPHQWLEQYGGALEEMVKVAQKAL